MSTLENKTPLENKKKKGPVLPAPSVKIGGE
jgi:hypothetical protein